MKPKRKQPIKWSPEIAYAVGLITADGCLYNDGRHIDFTSKDKELINAFKKCVGINNKIGWKTSGFTEKKYPKVQFSDVVLYRWLVSIGLTPNKSKTIGKLKIPNQYFFDFLRGHFDGDGSCYSYWDKRWRSSFMFYTTFTTGSLLHLKWIQSKIKKLLKINGYITAGKRCWQLKYAKKESKVLISKMYYKRNLPHLKRKYIKLKNIIRIDNEELDRKLRLNGRVLESVDSLN
ncbi:MAG: hypothetical protein KJI70_01990 [Patescibacteria group bacterium]|nr:hypothetical protein [Patescibacteria group bacterium]